MTTKYEKKLTTPQAFKAMVLFLEKYYEQTSSDDIGSLLGDLQLLDDECTADPAAWHEWIACINQATKEQDCMSETSKKTNINPE